MQNSTFSSRVIRFTGKKVILLFCIMIYIVMLSNIAMGELPEGLKESYPIGVDNEELYIVKKELGEKGYLSLEGISKGRYGESLISKVKQFQKYNGLEVNGELNKETMEKIFSDDAISAYDYEILAANDENLKKPMMVDFGKMYTDEYTQSMGLNFELNNMPQIYTIKAFELCVYPYDIWGDSMLDDNSVYRFTTIKTIEPGKKVKSNDIVIKNYDYSLNNIYVEVKRILLTDGTIIKADEEEQCRVNYILNE